MTGVTAERSWVPPPERVEQAAITRYLRWLRDERGLRFDGAQINYAEQSLWRALEPEWASRTAVVCESESRSRMEPIPRHPS